MNKDDFQLYPLDADTNTKLTLSLQGHSSQSSMVIVNQWKRILPNKKYVVIQNKSFSYQCTPLDKNCAIEVKISYQKYGSYISRAIASKPIKLANQMRDKTVGKPVQCLIIFDQFRTYMNVSVEKNKLKFGSDIGKLDIQLYENTLESDTNPTYVKVILKNSREEFSKFMNACLRRNQNYRSGFCLCVFNSKIERDILLSLSADLYQINLSASQIKRNGHSPIITKKPSDTSLGKNKQKQKIKVSEQLNLKRSNKAPSINLNASQKISPSNQTPLVSSNLMMSGQCLNIFEDEDQDFLNMNSTVPNISKHQTSMDLRGSFEELEKVSNINLDLEKHLDTSFTTNQNDNPQKLDKLTEENKQLKKKIQTLQSSSKQIVSLKKKYMASIQQINRLQNERRAIITDKVKYQSKYHKQYQQKQLILKQLEAYRAKYGK